MIRLTCGPASRIATLAFGVLLGCLTTGCSAQAWRQYNQTPKSPYWWVRSLFPPPGETFYSEKAHEIERSLNRHSGFDSELRESASKAN